MDTTFVETCLPCPECGSSDALAVNEDGSTKCFSCGTFDPIGNSERIYDKQMTKKTTEKLNPNGFIRGEALAITPRGINLDTCKKYSYHVGKDEYGNTVHIANYYNKDGGLIGQKLRDADKDFYVKGKVHASPVVVKVKHPEIFL